jgi:hypothetical protein
VSHLEIDERNVVWCQPIAPKDVVNKPLDPADIIASGQPDEAARERDIGEFDSGSVARPLIPFRSAVRFPVVVCG